MKKLHEYTLEELEQKLSESTLLPAAINEHIQHKDFENAVKTCNGITLDEFRKMCINKIDEICDLNGYN